MFFSKPKKETPADTAAAEAGTTTTSSAKPAPTSKPTDAASDTAPLKAQDPGSTPAPLQSLKDFRFPDERRPSLITAAVLDGQSQQAGDASLDSSSKKTKDSRHKRAKAAPRKVFRKLKHFGRRVKRKLQRGKKKMTPRAPKLHIQIDQPMQVAEDTTKVIGVPAPKPEA